MEKKDSKHPVVLEVSVFNLSHQDIKTETYDF